MVVMFGRFALAATVLLYFSSIGLANTCAVSYAALTSEMSWRSATTNPDHSGKFTATNKARERAIRRAVNEMTDNTLEEGVAAEMNIFMAAGVRKSYLHESAGYGSGEVTKIQVGKLGPTKKLNATLVLTSSGHTLSSHWDNLEKQLIPLEKRLAELNSASNSSAPSRSLMSMFSGTRGPDAEKRNIQAAIAKIKADPYWEKYDAEVWAVTDKYSVVVRYADGSQEFVVKDMPSKAVATVQEIEVDMSRGPVRILYERGGSAGSGGYIESRAFDIVPDGT